MIYFNNLIAQVSFLYLSVLFVNSFISVCCGQVSRVMYHMNVKSCKLQGVFLFKSLINCEFTLLHCYIAKIYCRLFILKTRFLGDWAIQCSQLYLKKLIMISQKASWKSQYFNTVFNFWKPCSHMRTSSCPLKKPSVG
jgi:hypothetical protein